MQNRSSSRYNRYRDDIFLLRYPCNASELNAYSEELEIEISRKYGSLADIFRFKSYTNRELPPKPTGKDAASEMIVYQAEVAEIKKSELRDIENRRNVAGEMYARLDISSKEILRRDPNFRSIETDPLKLWLAILRTHLVDDDGVKEETSYNARNLYYSAKQKKDETIDEFFKRFKQSYDALVSHNARELPEHELAIDFLWKLDDRYDNLRSTLHANVIQKAAKYPPNLAEAFEMAAHHLIAKPKNGKFVSQAAVFKMHQDLNEDEITCKNCGRIGHFKKNCPKLKIDHKPRENFHHKNKKNSQPLQEKNAEKKFLYKVQNANRYNVDNSEKSKLLIHLDSQAELSVFKDKELLRNMRNAEPIRVSGVLKGKYLYSNIIGDYKAIKGIYYCPDISANILAIDTVEKHGTVTYETSMFTIKLKDGELLKFPKTNNVFTHEEPRAHNNKAILITTVRNGIQNFTKREIRSAQEAISLQEKLGYPTSEELEKIINKGTIINCNVTAQDVRRSTHIFGKNINVSNGVCTKLSTKSIKYFETPLLNRELQKLYCDLFYIKEHAFLLSRSSPLDLIMVSNIKSKKTDEVESAIKDHLKNYIIKGFSIKEIYIDGEAAAKEMRAKNMIEGVSINISGAGDHVPQAEAAIKTVKNRARSIVNSLPYTLPNDWIPHLITFAVQRINMVPTRDESTSPRENFLGRKLDMSTDLKTTFGALVETYNPRASSNIFTPRVEVGIALYNTGNLQGTWVITKIPSKEIISRTNLKERVMDEETIEFINRLDIPKSKKFTLDPTDASAPPPENNAELSDQKISKFSEEITTTPNDAEIVFRTNDDETQKYKWVNVRDASVLKLSIKEAIKKHGVLAETAINEELKQMINQKVFIPIIPDPNELKSRIPSMLFLKEKHDEDGKITKIKARLVAGGHRQNRDEYEVEETYAPTPRPEIFYIVLMLAQSKNLYICAADIAGAYLNAKMQKDITMLLDKTTSEYLIKLDPSVKRYKDNYGRISVKLKQALYGCIESGKLWNINISNHLERSGFTKSKYCPCLFYKKNENKLELILIYVDDVLICTSTEQDADKILHNMKTQYGKITYQRNKGSINYLGIHLQFDQNGVALSAENFLEETFKIYGITDSRKSPAKNNIFESENSTHLSKEKKEKFHSTVAKLLYLAKRIRPDIMLAIAYLSTRVSTPTSEDEEKLIRVLKYLYGTKKEHFRINKCNYSHCKLDAYVDASYGTHEDAKGHTGISIKMNGNTLFFKSVKQKLVAKSSTEAELIAVSDALGDILHLKYIVEELTGEECKTKLHQDNQSTIALIKAGEPRSQRTRHINTRFFFIHDQYLNGKLEIEYCPTELMEADALTKPMQGYRMNKSNDNLFNKINSDCRDVLVK